MTIAELVDLSRTVAHPSEDCVILGEGNTSALADHHTFYVEASGRQLATADETAFVTVQQDPVVAALDGPPMDDQTTSQFLESALAPNSSPGKSSTETFMHAYLLSLEGVEVVVHTHPTPLLALLCLGNGQEIARQRLFPDEIVCCGPRACLIPYTDPGLPLGQAVRRGVQDYIREEHELPKTIWIQNHGLICIGGTGGEVLTATRMSVKAARVWLAALQTGQPLTTLTREQIQRIHQRPDEHYRQRLLWR